MSSVVTLNIPGESLEFEAHFLRRVLALSTSGLSYWDRCGVCRYANRAMEDWFGLQPDVLVGSAFRDVLPAVHLESHESFVAAVLRGEARSVVQTFRHPHGERNGLVRYLPDERNGVTVGFVLQVSVTPAELRLAL